MNKIQALQKRLDKLNITLGNSTYISTLEGYYRLYLDKNNITVKEPISDYKGIVVDLKEYSIADILPIIFNHNKPVFIIDDIEQ